MKPEVLEDGFTFMPISLIVLDKERTLVGPMYFNHVKKYIKLEFIHESLAEVWAIPIRDVRKIIYAILPCQMIWVAVDVPQLPGHQLDENPFPVIFSLGQTDQNLQLLDDFFHTACSDIVVNKVNPCDFVNAAGAEAERYLLYDLQLDDPGQYTYPWLPKPAIKEPQNDTSIVEEFVSGDEGEFSFTDRDAQVTVKFPNGLKKSIRYESLCKSLDENGWFCDDLVEIAVQHLIQEKLSKFPQWQKDVHIYDTFFFQKLKKFNSALATVKRNNHPQIMQLMYPLKGLQLMSTCACKYGIHRNVPEFKRPLLVIPICCSKHWILVLVHKPMDAIRDDASEFFKQGEKKRCSIIILDSLEYTEKNKLVLSDVGKQLHDAVFNCIKNWLFLMHWHDDWTEEPNVKTGCVKVIPPNLPKQPNSNDCGVYMLKFFEEFILDDWTWTDWNYKKLEKMEVKDPDEMHDQVASYRAKLNQTIRSLATNLPKRPANMEIFDI